MDIPETVAASGSPGRPDKAADRQQALLRAQVGAAITDIADLRFRITVAVWGGLLMAAALVSTAVPWLIDQSDDYDILTAYLQTKWLSLWDLVGFQYAGGEFSGDLVHPAGWPGAVTVVIGALLITVIICAAVAARPSAGLAVYAGIACCVTLAAEWRLWAEIPTSNGSSQIGRYHIGVGWYAGIIVTIGLGAWAFITARAAKVRSR